MSVPPTDLPSFADQTIVRLRPQLADDGHGNLEPDWTLTPSSLSITGCLVAPGGTVEDNTNRSGVLIQWTVYAPGAPDVVASDAIEYEGTRYAVDGEPARWGNTVVALRRWEG